MIALAMISFCSFIGHSNGYDTDNKFLVREHLNSGHHRVFADYIRDYGKQYETEDEYHFRYKVFNRNMMKARILQKNEKGTAEYGITKFSDLTSSEFRKMLGLNPHLKSEKTTMVKATIPNITIPAQFDWREQNVVTEIKNQGTCGSCWAFSTTGNIEGLYAIKHKHLYSLSEQELVDCDKKDHGCGGGLPENAYEALIELGGLETEKGYPYEGEDGKCELDKEKIKVKVNGSLELPQDEEQLAQWLVQNGPISIGINANGMQFYRGGVSHPFRFLCKPANLNHGVLIVGYGIHKYPLFHVELPFWIIKNSWGPNWGEQGYYRVYRGDGTCGVNQMATSAIIP